MTASACGFKLRMPENTFICCDSVVEVKIIPWRITGRYAESAATLTLGVCWHSPRNALERLLQRSRNLQKWQKFQNQSPRLGPLLGSKILKSQHHLIHTTFGLAIMSLLDPQMASLDASLQVQEAPLGLLKRLLECLTSLN